jgi:hypothetical protein
MYYLKSRIILFAYSACLLFLLMLLQPLSCFGSSDSQTIMEVLSARLERMSNIIVEYESEIEYSPLASDVPATTDLGQGRFIALTTGNEKYKEEFSILDNMSLYRKDLKSYQRNDAVDLGVTLSPYETIVYTYQKDKLEYLCTKKMSKLGTISNNLSLPSEFCDIEAALVLRLPKIGKRLDSESEINMDITSADNDNIKLVISKETKGYIYEIMISRELGYAPVSLVMKEADGDIRLQMQMSDFKNTEGLMLPYKIHKLRYEYTNGRLEERESVDFIVKQYSINDPRNVPEKYKIDWPENTMVYDTRSGITYRAVSGKLVNSSVEKAINEAINSDNMPVTTQSSEPANAKEQQKPDILETSEAIEDRNVNNDVLGQTQTERKSLSIFAYLAGLVLITSLIYLIHTRKKHVE